MDTKQIKAIMRCLDDDLNETYGPGAIDAACAAIDALEADANRYRAVCSLIYEPDAAKQMRMLAAFDNIHPLASLPPTLEEFAGLVDTCIAALEEARNANG